ncbi:hypothetical protein MY4824_000398 [Beauveria thailandica]
MGAEGTYVRHPGASTAQRPLVISANSACPFSPSAVTSPHRSCNPASKLTAVLSSNWSGDWFQLHWIEKLLLITAHCHPVIFAFAGYPSCAVVQPPAHRPCFSAVPVTTPRCATPSPPESPSVPTRVLP